MEVIVFYAWQADCPGKVNRYLIREAAADACARITADDSNDWEVVLDSDTQGEAGMCDIPNTILQKIQKCDIFLFDIKGRASLRYAAEESESTAVRKKVTEHLSKSLEEVFRITIATVIEPRRLEADAAASKSDQEVKKAFAGRVLSGDFHGFDMLPAVLTSIQFRWPKQLKYEPASEAVGAFIGVNTTTDADAIIWNGNGSFTELALDGQLLHAYGVSVRPSPLLTRMV